MVHVQKDINARLIDGTDMPQRLLRIGGGRLRVHLYVESLQTFRNRPAEQRPVTPRRPTGNVHRSARRNKFSSCVSTSTSGTRDSRTSVRSCWSCITVTLACRKRRFYTPYRAPDAAQVTHFGRARERWRHNCLTQSGQKTMNSCRAPACLPICAGPPCSG